MRRYESIWVVNGDLPDEDVKAAIDKFAKIIAANEGTLVSVEEWGRKKLAYKIQGATRVFMSWWTTPGRRPPSRNWSGTTASTTASSAPSPPKNPTK